MHMQFRSFHECTCVMGRGGAFSKREPPPEFAFVGFYSFVVTFSPLLLVACALHPICPGGRSAFFSIELWCVCVCGWFWLMCCVCLLIASCVDGDGVGPLVHLYLLSALHLKCLVDRVELF